METARDSVHADHAAISNTTTVSEVAATGRADRRAMVARARNRQYRLASSWSPHERRLSLRPRLRMVVTAQGAASLDFLDEAGKPL